MFIAKNTRAAMKSVTLIIFISDSSFIKTNGRRNKLSIKIHKSLVMAKLGLSGSTSDQNRVIIIDFIISPKTLKNMIIRKKLLTNMVKLIQNIDGLPIIKKPISYIEPGLSGHIDLVFKYKTLLTRT